MCYLIKRLGSQELGSVREGGTPRRGRYILISNNQQALNFFPPLSEVILNHSAIIPIIPLYNQTPQRVYCNFVYHNSKLVEGRPNGRNEHRLYLNNAIENNTLLFREGDLVIFKQDTQNLTLTQDYDSEDESPHCPIYPIFLYHCQDHDSPLFQRCSHILETNSLPQSRGSYAILQEPLPEVEECIQLLTRTAAGNYTPAVDNTVVNRINDSTTEANISSLFTPISFRDFVMTGYNFECAVTRNVIRYHDIFNLETAHIRARSHGGTFMPSNGIALSRDIHWAFDRGMFTIDDDYNIIVHPEMQNGYLGQFNHQQIFVPDNPFFRPDTENLRYHREHLYGLFLNSASLINAPGYVGNR